MVQEGVGQAASMMALRTEVVLHTWSAAAEVGGAGWAHSQEEAVLDRSRGFVHTPRVPFLFPRNGFREQGVRPCYIPHRGHYHVFLAHSRQPLVSCPTRRGEGDRRNRDHPCLVHVRVPFVHLCLPIPDDENFARPSYPFNSASELNAHNTIFVPTFGRAVVHLCPKRVRFP